MKAVFIFSPREKKLGTLSSRGSQYFTCLSRCECSKRSFLEVLGSVLIGLHINRGTKKIIFYFLLIIKVLWSLLLGPSIDLISSRFKFLLMFLFNGVETCNDQIELACYLSFEHPFS